MARKLDYSRRPRALRSTISEGEEKDYKREAEQLRIRQKRKIKTKNKTTRNSGPVRVYTAEERDAWAACTS